MIRQEQVLVPNLCGLVKEGGPVGDGHIIIRFARLEDVRPDGHLA